MPFAQDIMERARNMMGQFVHVDPKFLVKCAVDGAAKNDRSYHAYALGILFALKKRNADDEIQDIMGSLPDRRVRQFYQKAIAN